MCAALHGRNVVSGDLLGREAESARILGLLTGRPRSRLVTLCGPSGVGKTALALESASRLEALGHRVVVVRLANTVKTRDLLLAVASEVGLPLGSGPLLDRIAAIGTDERILVVDNCEHLSGDPHPLAVLQDAWPGVRLLTTSVRALKTPGEELIVVDPLELPALDGDPQAVREAPSVQLYLRRAAETASGFDPAAASLDDVARLCHQVGGLPLGIELLAARVATMPPESAGSVLRSGRLIGLEQPRAGAPVSERHQSLRAALRWTYELITPDAAALLRRMSVFSAPMTLERLLTWEAPGAEAPGPVGSRESTVLDQIAELVDVQLVRQRRVHGHPTFELLPLVREFAREELDRQDESAAARRWRRSVMLEFAESRKAALSLSAHRTPMSEITVCETDLRQVLDEYVEEGDLAAGMRLATVLAIVAFQRAYDGFVADALERMIAAAESHPRVPEPLLVEAMLSHAQIRILIERRVDLERDVAWFTDATRRALASDEPQLQLFAHALIIRSLHITRDVSGAAASSAQGLALAHSLGDERWIARFSGWVAMAYTMRSDLDQAIRVARRGVDAVAASDDRVATVTLWMALQNLPAGAARPLLARLPGLDELLAGARAVGDRRSESLLLRVAAGAASLRGDLAGAARHVQGCLRIGGPALATDALTSMAAVLAQVAVGRGHHVSAARFLGMLEHQEQILVSGTPPTWMVSHRRTIARVRSALGAGFDAAYRVGAEDPLADRPRILLAYAEQAATDSTSHADEPAEIVIPAPRRALTPREHDVLAALATGATNRQISTQLGVSPKTVMHHSVSIYRKLGVHSRAEATAWAYKSGLLS